VNYEITVELFIGSN